MTTDTDRALRRFAAVLSVKGWGDAPIGGIDDADLAAAMRVALSPAQSEAGEREVEAAYREGYAQGLADGDKHHIPDDAWRVSEARSNLSTPPKDSEAAATNGELAKALADLERSIELHEEAKPCDPWIELHVDDARCILTALGAKP